MCVGFVFLLFVGYGQHKNQYALDTNRIHNLEEVVVTATRTERQLSSVPLAVTLVSNKDIKRAGTTRLRNILQEQTGMVFVKDASGFEGIQMQGLNAAYTLILVDGFPLIGRSAGVLDLKRISVNNIKQIEIVKGPSSSLYGSEAIGGVINIITDTSMKVRHEGSVQYYAKGGERNELDLNTNYTYQGRRLGIQTGMNYNSSAGYDLSPDSPRMTNDPYENFTGNIGLNYTFHENFKLNASQRYYQQKQHVLSNTNTLKEHNSNIKLGHAISKNVHLDYTFYRTTYETKSMFNGSLSYYNQIAIRPEVRAIVKVKNGKFIGGIGTSFDALDRTFFAKKESFETQYLYGQYDFTPSKDVNLIVGARYDRHNKYKSAFSPKVSARYRLNDWMAIKSSVGFGFKAPDFRELFFNFNNSAGGYLVYGVRTMHELFGQNTQVIDQVSKDLNPENSIGYNVGFQLQPMPAVKLAVNLFRNDIKDLINTAVFSGALPGVNPSTRVFYYENRSKVYTQGVELDASIKISDHMSISGGYQLLTARDKEQEALIKSGSVYFRPTPSSSSQRLTMDAYAGLANRSKHTANLKLFYQNYKHDYDATIRTIYRSKYALYDTNNSQGIIDAFDKFVRGNLLVNTSFSKSIDKLAVLQLGVDNLFNTTGAKNKNLFPNTDAVLNVGRTFFGSVQINF